MWIFTLLLLDVRVSLSLRGGGGEPSRSSPRTPLLSPRWPLGGARPQGWAASSSAALIVCQHLKQFVLQTFAVVKSAFVCPAWVTLIFSFFPLQSVCLHFGIKAWREGAAVKRSTEKHSDGHICYVSPVGSQLKGCSRGNTCNLIQTFIFCSWFSYK